MILFIFVFLILIGTFGFHFIEEISIIDAFYFTIVSITTVGYGDVVPLTTVGKLFASMLLIGGISLFGIVIIRFGSEYLTSKIEEVMGFVRKRRKMKNHCIICGAGNTGKIIMEELKKAKRPYLIIEKNPEIVKQLTKEKVPALYGDVLDEKVLKDADIKKAKTLISALDKDADAVFLIVTAKSLKPRLKVIVQVNEQKNIDKMYKVGANEVVCPQVASAKMLAHAALEK